MNLPEEQISRIDRPEVPETFVDSLGFFTVDGPIVRIELCVTRMDAPKPPNPPTAKRHPVCRLVLTPDVIITLSNQLNNIMSHLEKVGLIIKKEGKPPEAKPEAKEDTKLVS
jgi:hypothetical protein